MKRLFWPAVAAIVFHAAVLWLNPDIRKGVPVQVIRNEPLHLSLVSAVSQPKKPEASAVHPQVVNPSTAEPKKVSQRVIRSKNAVIPEKPSAGIREKSSPLKTGEPTDVSPPQAETTAVSDETSISEDSVSVPVTLPMRAASLHAHSGEQNTPPSSLPLKEAVPIYKSNPPPEYPAVARRKGYEGTAILEVLVNREGAVADLRLSQSSGYPVLDQAALASVKGWIFVPGRKGEDAVEMWVKVPICFLLKD